MRYFTHQNPLKFFLEPEAFDKLTPRHTLQYALGANLYMPATQRGIFDKLSQGSFNDLGAVSLCMEDAISANELPQAQEAVLDLLSRLASLCRPDEFPLLFVRVRSPQQFKQFAAKLGTAQLHVLAGFIFPKFNSSNGEAFFSTLNHLREQSGETLYAMPVIEDRRVMYKETRFDELQQIQRLLMQHREQVLNVRVGGTDFSSIYGLRREVDTTIYDIKVVADCLKDVLNFFLRDECGFVVSGPVWEYYSWNPDSPEMRGLRRELSLDMQNGFQGKTIIHPSQISVVNKAYIVPFDTYQDAQSILHSQGGAFASVGGNRMNETTPHRSWAQKVMAKARIFGVAEKNVTL